MKRTTVDRLRHGDVAYVPAMNRTWRVEVDRRRHSVAVSAAIDERRPGGPAVTDSTAVGSVSLVGAIVDYAPLDAIAPGSVIHNVLTVPEGTPALREPRTR